MNPGSIICRLPQWDYAMAGYVISSLPGEVRNVLNRSQFLTLQMLLYLIGLHARKSGRQSAYAVPSQLYLGKCVGRTDRTIRRVTARLVSLQLLCVRRRFSPGRDPQTNLYTLGGELLALLHNIKWPKSLIKSAPDINGRQRPKERSRHRAQSSSGVIEAYHDSHKPFSFTRWEEEEGNRLISKEVASNGFAKLYRKLAGK